MASNDEQILMGQPPYGAVEKAVAESRARDEADGGGRVLKVLYLDDAGEPVGEWASSQLPENPFAEHKISGLQEPPFPLEQLVYLAESHPVHSSSLEQKTADICGEGWGWTAENDALADEAEKDALEEWLQALAPDEMDIEDILNAAWLDKETIGWGLVELARDPSGVVRRLYHVPGHTVRAHKDGFRLCQIRDQRKVWFRRWGSTDVEGKPVEVDAKTGSKTSVREPANDLFVLKSPSRRSSWYGIPGYISAIGWITLGLAARDDNILFFHNRREPRWAIILSGLDDNDGLEEELRRSFTVDLKQPYRNILLPLTGTAKVDFQKMSDTAKDGSFPKLSEDASRMILIAHRVPPERVSAATAGPLGGNIVAEANRIYKDAVVDPGQRFLNKRIRRLIDVEFAIATQPKTTAEKAAEKEQKSKWLFTLNDLDISNEKEDLDVVVASFKSNLLTLREARNKMKLGPLMVPEIGEDGQPVLDEDGEPAEKESPYNDKLYTELPGVGKGASPAENPEAGDAETGLGLTPALASRDPALALLDADVRELLTSSQAVQDRLEELAEEARQQRDKS